MTSGEREIAYPSARTGLPQRRQTSSYMVNVEADRGELEEDGREGRRGAGVI